MQDAVRPVRYVRAKNHERSLREVDDVHDAPDQREAEANRRIEAPEEDPVDDVLCHVGAPAIGSCHMVECSPLALHGRTTAGKARTPTGVPALHHTSRSRALTPPAWVSLRLNLGYPISAGRTVGSGTAGWP